MLSRSALDSIVFLNGDVAVDVLDALSAFGQGDRQIRCVLCLRRATKPNHAIRVGVDMNATKTLNMLSGELGLDL